MRRKDEVRCQLNVILSGPVVKQGALNLSKPTSESSASEEHPEEGSVTNEQENLVTNETEDEETKKTIELKDPSACKSNV